KIASAAGPHPHLSPHGKMSNSTGIKPELSSGQLAKLGFCSLGASLLVILMGFLGLLGWALDSVPLRSVFKALPPMVPNTAIGLLLSGLSMELLRIEPVRKTRRSLGNACAVAVCLLAAL